VIVEETVDNVDVAHQGTVRIKRGPKKITQEKCQSQKHLSKLFPAAVSSRADIDEKKRSWQEADVHMLAKVARQRMKSKCLNCGQLWMFYGC